MRWAGRLMTEKTSALIREMASGWINKPSSLAGTARSVPGL